MDHVCYPCGPMVELAEQTPFSLIRVKNVDWEFEDPEYNLGLFEDKYVRFAARGVVDLVVEHGDASHQTSIDIGFWCLIDPKMSLDFVEVDTDAYLSFIGPPATGETEVDDERNRAAMGEFAGHLLGVCGDVIRDALEDMLRLPTALLKEVQEQLVAMSDSISWGLDWIARTVMLGLKRALESAQATLTAFVGGLYQAATYAGTALLTAPNKIAELGEGVFHRMVLGLQAIYDASVEQALSLYTVLVESGYKLIDNIKTLGNAFGEYCTALWQHAIEIGADAKAYIFDVLSHAVARLVSAHGWVRDKIGETITMMHTRLAPFVGPVLVVFNDPEAFGDWLGEFTAEVITRVYQLTGAAMSTLCEYAVDLGRLYLNAVKAFALLGFKVYYNILRFAYSAVYWWGKTVYAILSGDEEARADVWFTLVQPWVTFVCDTFGPVGAMAVEQFGRLLTKAAEYGQFMLEGLVETYLQAKDTLRLIIGEENFARVVAALELIQGYLRSVKDVVQGFLHTIHQLATFITKELRTRVEGVIAKVSAVVELAKAGVGRILKMAYEAAMAALLGHVSLWIDLFRLLYKLAEFIFGALVAIVEPYSTIANKVGEAITDYVEAALVAMREHVFEALGFESDGAELEFSLQSVAVSAARLNRRSRTSIEVMEPLSTQEIIGSSVVFPVLRALGAGDDALGVLCLRSFFNHRYQAPHPGTLMTGPSATPDSNAQRVPDDQRMLAMPIAGAGGFRASLCINPLCYVIDPRYSWGYGASMQMKLADIDGDRRLEAWEVERMLQDDSAGDLNHDGVADAQDVQLMLAQAENVLHGIPYRLLSSPLGLRIRFADGSWLFYTVAGIGNEDVGLRKDAKKSPDTSAQDPDQLEKSVKRAGPGGTARPSKVKIDREGVGYFMQGQVDIARMFHPDAAPGYPVAFHYESRRFTDTLESGLSNRGQSDFIVVRGGEDGSDFQLRLFSYMNPDLRYTPPWMMIAPTLKMTMRLGGGGAAAIAAEGGIRIGLRYNASIPIAEISHLLSERFEKGQENFDKANKKLTEEPVKTALETITNLLGFEELLKHIRRAAAPLVSVFMHEEDFEASIAALQAIFVGDAMAVRVRLSWAQRSPTRKRLQQTLTRAVELLEHWEASLETRELVQGMLEAFGKKTAAERRQPGVKEAFELSVQGLWRGTGRTKTGGILDEASIVALQRMQELWLAFKRDVVEKSGDDPAWAKKTDADRQQAFTDWAASKRIEFYWSQAEPIIDAVDDALLDADISKAIDLVSEAFASIKRDPHAEVNALAEATLSIAALFEIFTKLITSVHSLCSGVSKPPAKNGEGEGQATRPRTMDEVGKNAVQNLAKELAKQRKEVAEKHQELMDARKKAAEEGNAPADAVDALKQHSKFGAAFAETTQHVEDPYWAYDYLEEPIKNPENFIALGDDSISFVWGADASAGLGVGGDAAGAGASAKAVGGVKFSAPSFTFGVKLFEGIPNKLRIFRFIARVVRHFLPIFTYRQEVDSSDQKLNWEGGFGVIVGDILLSLVFAIVETLRDLVHPMTGDADWLESFLTGCTLSTSVSGVVKASANAAVIGARVRADAELRISTTLGSILDPFIRVLEQGLAASDVKALLHEKLVTKVSVECQQSLDVGFTLGAFQLDVGGSAKAFEGDFVLPDGSSWRDELDTTIDEWTQSLSRYLKRGKEQIQSDTSVGRFASACAFLDIWDGVLREQIRHLDSSGGANAKALITNPLIGELLQMLSDPEAAKQEQDARSDELKSALAAIQTIEHGCYVFPGTPNLRLKVEALPDKPRYTASLLVHKDDADRFGSASEYARTDWERFSLEWALDPVPVDVRVDAYAKKDKETESVNGIIAGFERKTDAEAFLANRPAEWVTDRIVAEKPWRSPHADGIGRGEWYVWVTTKIHELQGKYKDARKSFGLPKVRASKTGMRLTFSLVERDIMTDEDLAGLPVTRVAEEELTEIKVLTDARPDEVARLHNGVAKYGQGATDTPTDATDVVQFALVDRDGQPVPGEPYTVSLGGNVVAEGVLDGRGQGRVPVSEAEEHQLRFPNLDDEQWGEEAGSPPQPAGFEAEPYIVQASETVQSILYRERGVIDMDATINAAENELLFAMRAPHMLVMGDKLVLPVEGSRGQKQVAVAIGETPQLHLWGSSRRLHLDLQHGGQSLGAIPYTLLFGGMQVDGFLNDQGVLDTPIPWGTSETELIVMGRRRLLIVGGLEPVHTLRGVQARLNNIGFYAGPVDGLWGSQTRRAVRRFQAAGSLQVDGLVGPKTREALLEAYGE